MIEITQKLKNRQNNFDKWFVSFIALQHVKLQEIVSTPLHFWNYMYTGYYQTEFVYMPILQYRKALMFTLVWPLQNF